ncbi:TRAP transporter small permease [Roseomonas sp. SSH11]|uniref:TRAP transporter small permease protein n=1 Tax=Pararoseomonas baculiformis TaxID=2820812 RepID=A0ABS4AGR2_9PROT|nr:TRAP transporter small permease [Pararoseomonas baculiformis]MBP0446211.1 TRAP transporter small permease [Pararoseomonas baculiformis]
MQRAIALLSRFACGLASVSTVVCLVLIGASVVARYLFHTPQPWIDKVAGWLVVALVLLAAPEAQRRFEHIGVDVAVGRMGPGLARAAHLLGAASVAAVAAILLWAGWEAVEFSRMVGLMTEIEGVPEWWIQLLLPVGSAVLLLVALAQCIVLATGGRPENLPSGDEELPRDTLAHGE